MPGVYQIIHSASGLYYLGSAGDIPRRLRSHRRHLRLGNHRNPRLQNYWDKYGEEAFEFQILEETPDYLAREQFYLDRLRPYEREIGFNYRRTARGFNHTDARNNALKIWERVRSDPGNYAKRLEDLRSMSPKGVEALLKKLNEDPVFRERYRSLTAANLVKARSTPGKRWNTDPSPAVKARISTSLRILWQDPIYRAMQSAARKGRKRKGRRYGRRFKTSEE
jgi:group I intron endonuclease